MGKKSKEKLPTAQIQAENAIYISCISISAPLQIIFHL